LVPYFKTQLFGPSILKVNILLWSSSHFNDVASLLILWRLAGISNWKIFFAIH
jgi:hypothetical protein